MNVAKNSPHITYLLLDTIKQIFSTSLCALIVKNVFHPQAMAC